MSFAGLAFGQLALIFGAAAALVVVFYLLKLRRRVTAVPFALLWSRVLQEKEATRLFAKLRRVLSLLLQLLLLLLLVLALGDPRAKGALLAGRNLVVLVDASASMQATDVGPSRLGAAKAEVKRLVRGLGGADRMLLAQMDATVTPLGPMSGDTAELERALDGIEPTDTRADFPRALRFATDVLRGLDHAEIVVVSDGALGPPEDASGPVPLGGARLAFVKVGAEARNIGLTQFAVRRYPLDRARYEVMLEITNPGPDVADVELSLLGDGQLVDLTKLRLQPGERLPRFYPSLSGASRTLEARIAPLAGTRDDLAADNVAYALLPERRRTKVLVVTEGNMYLEAALLLDEYLDVVQVKPAGYLAALAGGRFDAVIFDGVTPAEMAKVPALYLDPRGSGPPLKVGAELAAPGFDKVDRKHPLVRFLALEDVNIARGHRLELGPGDRAVGLSESAPILVAGVRSGVRFAALGFDVRESDLPLRVAWPLLLLNTLHWFTDEDSDYLSSFRTGEVWRVPVGSGVARATVKGPGGEELVPVLEGRASLRGRRAGFYELTTAAQGGEGPVTVGFAANLLDPEETAIAPLDRLEVGGQPAGEVGSFEVGVRREIWIYLLLAVALLTALEWATYHRRVTV